MTRRAAFPRLVLLLALPALAGAEERVPGVYWEQSVEMQVAGFAIPAQTMQVCMPKGTWEEPPTAGPDDDCQVSDLKRTGSRMTWKVKCRDGTSGTGDMTYGPSSFQGTMTMQTQGQNVRTAIKGKKLGGDCDANESKRQVEELQQFAADQQAMQAEAQAEACVTAVEEMQVLAFQPPVAGMPAQCKEKVSTFCKRLQTREGLLAFREGSGQPDARAQAEQLCKVRLADVEAKLCAAAAKEQARGRRLEGEAVEFVFASCPDQAQALAKSECAGRSYTSLPSAQREFCTRYAREQLDQGEPEPSRPSLPLPDVKREILKGLFGR